MAFDEIARMLVVGTLGALVSHYVTSRSLERKIDRFNTYLAIICKKLEIPMGD
jgi:hypothetical protein